MAWKLAQSPRVSKIYCAPGNAGIAALATCLPIRADDLPGLLEFAKQQHMDLTIVGPEAPLVAGIVDLFESEGLRIFGPSKMAAQIEGSKVFAKRFMERHGIPTASFQVFDDSREAKEFIRKNHAPLVVKADGLAAGKGVVVAQTDQEALDAVIWMMEERVFGDAGRQVVIEDCLVGEEASFMIVTDGHRMAALPSAQDHKRIRDGDTGPNTGGMGAYSPAPVITSDMERWILDHVMSPAIRGFEKDGGLYRGILYAGLMISGEGIRVLEFNCRLGDPEAQVLLSRLDSDLLDIFEGTLRGDLDGSSIRWTSKSSVCVVLAAGGYPEKPEKGKRITGLPVAGSRDLNVFHAATCREGDILLTDGGRVLGVTALGDEIDQALQNVYSAVGQIKFDGMQYRKDIGAKARRRRTS